VKGKLLNRQVGLGTDFELVTDSYQRRNTMFMINSTAADVSPRQQAHQHPSVLLPARLVRCRGFIVIASTSGSTGVA